MQPPLCQPEIILQNNGNIVTIVKILAVVLTWIKAQKVTEYLLIFGQSTSGTNLKWFSLII